MRAVIIAAGVLAAQGCTHHLRPPVDPPLLQGPPRELSVNLVISEALEQQKDSWGRFKTMGYANEWICETGRAFTPAALVTLQQLFRTVTVQRDRTNPTAPADLTVVITHAKVSQSPNWEWVSTFSLQVGVVDAYGQTLFARRYQESAEGDSLVALWGGAIVADEVLARPTGRAMAKTLELLAEDLARLEVHRHIPQL